MNRKGFLLAEETLKIILAVIAIGFLVYFLAALYFNNQDEKDLELATASLEHLVEEIDLGSSEVKIFNPNGWSLMSWPFEGDIPLSCSNVGWDICICICKAPLVGFSGNYLDNCNDKGICLENKKGFIVGENTPSPIYIKNPPITLNINSENKKITLK